MKVPYNYGYHCLYYIYIHLTGVALWPQLLFHYICCVAKFKVVCLNGSLGLQFECRFATATLEKETRPLVDPLIIVFFLKLGGRIDVSTNNVYHVLRPHDYFRATISHQQATRIHYGIFVAQHQTVQTGKASKPTRTPSETSLIYTCTCRSTYD